MTRWLPVLGALSATVLARPAPTGFDYIVVGGGTSGLVVANRLSEQPDVSVLVVEAGDSVYNNPNVTNVNGYGLAFGTDIDWQYESVPQEYGGNLTQVLRGGKALAGTSAINGMVYTRAEDVQIDIWEHIGNKGWTWESLMPYFLKSENLTTPSKAQVSSGIEYHADVHGNSGPLHVSFTDTSAGNGTVALNKTYQELGLPWTEEMNGGKMRGFSIYPSTVDYEKYVREDAARAYYWPYKSRENLMVLRNTHANRLVWSHQSPRRGEQTAAGVEITYQNGTVGAIHANKEVILSAGALKSPALLELSGIGNPDILHKHNITVRVDLPTVGENLQDQINTGLAASGHSTISTAKNVAYLSAHDLFGDKSDAIAAEVRAHLREYAHATAEVSHGTMRAEDLERLFDIQFDLIFKHHVPVAEILMYGSGKSLASEYWSLLPFARGNVHIVSPITSQQPAINPNYLMFDWDMQGQVAIAQYIRKVFQTGSMSHLIEKETMPGAAEVPFNATDKAWEDWILDGNYRSNFHPVGTAAMMPREIGGVVDASLKVYGTSNVRVVDASVLPFQVCGHLVSTLYAVAEKAADIIKEEAKFPHGRH